MGYWYYDVWFMIEVDEVELLVILSELKDLCWVEIVWMLDFSIEELML